MRIILDEREGIVNDFVGHYQKLLETYPDFVIKDGFGLPQLKALRQQWLTKRDALGTLSDLDLPNLRAQRDALWGLSPLDGAGLWFFLSNYKSALSLRLPTGHPLRAIVPNIGRTTPGLYAAIAARFHEHWTRVNAALLPAKPFVVGTLTIAALESKLATLTTLIRQIDEADSTQTRLARAEIEHLFGDVTEPLRDPNSIIARLRAYSVLVQVTFPGSPLAESLPRIYPVGSSDTVTFRFNFVAENGGVRVWLERPGGIDGATQLFLKEGAEERTTPLPATGAIPTVTFADLSVSEDIDGLELRDASGRTLADGVFDSTLPSSA